MTDEEKKEFERELRRASLKGDQEHVQRLLRYAAMEDSMYLDAEGLLHSADGSLVRGWRKNEERRKDDKNI